MIGNGTSGQHIIPNSLTKASHIDHYVRSEVYVTPKSREGLFLASGDIPGGHIYTDEEKRRFAEDPLAYVEYRRTLEKGMSGKWYDFPVDRMAIRQFKEQILENMLQHLGTIKPGWKK